MNKRHLVSIRSVVKQALSALTGVLLFGAVAHGQDAKPPEKKGWETVGSAGLTLTRGNSKNLLATIGVNTARKWAHDEALGGIRLSYGETSVDGEDTTTQQDVKGFFQYNHLFTERFYGGLRLDGVYDKVAGIHYRFTVSPMTGYYFIKTTNTFLSGEIGPSFITEEVVSRFTVTTPTATNHVKRIDQNSYVGFRLGERFERKFGGGAKIWQTLEWIPQVDDFDNWILNAEVGLSAPVNKKLDARLVLQDTYDNVPPAGREKNDLRLVAGLGYKF